MYSIQSPVAFVDTGLFRCIYVTLLYSLLIFSTFFFEIRWAKRKATCCL